MSFFDQFQKEGIEFAYPAQAIFFNREVAGSDLRRANKSSFHRRYSLNFIVIDTAVFIVYKFRAGLFMEIKPSS